MFKDAGLIFKLAFRNLAGTGIRLWINVSVIAISIIIVIFARSVHAGLGNQIKDSVIRTEVAAGQLISKGFDPFDPITFETSCRRIPEGLDRIAEKTDFTAVLYCSATAYTRGIPHGVTIRGIQPGQKVLELPTDCLANKMDRRPVLVGTRMLEIMGLKKGDPVTIKWRDRSGAFDADEFMIVEVMDKNNSRVDSNVLWMSLQTLQDMYSLGNKASLVIFRKETDFQAAGELKSSGWEARSSDELTRWIRDMINSKEKGNLFIFALLVFLCCVGIFNSQILEVFKRTREIGILMAMGLRRMQVMLLFTLEGIITSFLGIAGAILLGTPVFYWTARAGIPLDHAQGMGMPIPERLYPFYSPQIISITLLIVILLTTLTAWFPTWKIARMEAAKAISGRK